MNVRAGGPVDAGGAASRACAHPRQHRTSPAAGCRSWPGPGPGSGRARASTRDTRIPQKGSAGAPPESHENGGTLVAWFLVDDQLPLDPRMLAVSLAARGLWATAGAWASGRKNDVVPDHVLTSLGGTPELAEELADAEVWHRTRGGWQFVQDGLCRIPSRETADRKRQQATARQARYRQGKRQRRGDGDADVDAPERLHVDAVDNPKPDRAERNGSSQARSRRDVDASTTASPGPSPALNGGAVISRTNGSSQPAPPDEMTEMIMTEVLQRTGRHITPDWAAKVAGHVLQGRQTAQPVSYVRQAIRADPDPARRFLPVY